MNRGYIDGYMYKEASTALLGRTIVSMAKPGAYLRQARYRTPPTIARLMSMVGKPGGSPGGPPGQALTRAEVGKQFDDIAKGHLERYPPAGPSLTQSAIRALDPGRKASAAARDARDFAKYHANRARQGGNMYAPQGIGKAEAITAHSTKASQELARARRLQALAYGQRGGAAAAVAASPAMFLRPGQSQPTLAKTDSDATTAAGTGSAPVISLSDKAKELFR